MLYSFEQIAAQKTADFEIVPTCSVSVGVPEGYVLETVRDANARGDAVQGQLMLFDPDETQRSDKGGRVYMRAARVMQRVQLGDFGLTGSAFDSSYKP
jgi:hypothetical protein